MLQSIQSLYLFRRPLLGLVVVFCALLAGLKRTGIFDRIPAQDPSAWAGGVGSVIGTVAAHPDPRPTGTVYLLDVEVVEPFDGSYLRHAARGPLLLHVLKSTAAFAEPGDRMRAVGRLQLPRAANTPGAFDYQEYLSNHGIHALIYTSSRSVQNLGPSGKMTLMKWGWRVKQKAVGIFNRNLNGEQATVLSGLTVGSRPRFHPEIKQMFVESGTMHVLVASGSNVAFVIALWFFFLRLVRVGRRWALGTSVFPVWSYVLIAGADAPIIRAGLMGTVGVVSYLIAREDRPYHALGLAALLLLVFSPAYLFDAGFQMSFLTVFGLLYFLSPLEALMTSWPAWTRWPVRLVAASLTAQIWLFPIGANVFGRVFPLGVVSNMAVVPLAALGLSAGVALTLAEIQPVVFLVRSYLDLLLGLVKFFATHLGWSLWLRPLDPLSILGFYGCVLSAVFLRRSWTARVAFGCGALAMLIGFGTNRPAKPKALSVTWIDTGKRLTTIVRSADGKHLLINPGPKEPFDSTERSLMPLLTRLNIKKFDAVLITDPDPARTSGVESLLKWTRVSTVVFCGPGLMWIGSADEKILLAHGLTLKAQDYLLAHPVAQIKVIQSHFPKRWLWRPEFLKRYKPELVIETFAASRFRPSVPPWDDVPLLIPQKTGWAEWEGSVPVTLEKRNRDKAGKKSTGVRPPSHAAHLTARRGDRD